VGTIFLAVGVGIGAWAYHFGAEANQAEGVVIRMVSSGRKGGSSPVVRYEVDGQSYELQSTVSSSPPAYSVGEKVTVLYHPDNPGGGQIDSFIDRWLFPLVFGGMGFIFAAIGYGFLLVRLRSRRLVAPARPSNQR
jgi:hypothetical protein